MDKKTSDKKVAIGTTTRCFRQSKRHDLLTGQWEQKRYQQHRDRITNAEPRIDVKTPISDSFQHVKLKPKKMQHEDERGMEVMMHNLILLRHLTEISNSKRVDDGIPMKSRQRMSWNGYYDTILNMRRLQLEDMRQILLDGGNVEEANEYRNQPGEKHTDRLIHDMMSSSSPSDGRKDESTPSVLVSTTPTSGIPKQGRSSSKRIRPRTAGPMGGGRRRGTSRGNANEKFIDDNSKEKRTVEDKNNESKVKDGSKRIRSTSSQGRQQF